MCIYSTSLNLTWNYFSCYTAKLILFGNFGKCFFLLHTLNFVTNECHHDLIYDLILILFRCVCSSSRAFLLTKLRIISALCTVFKISTMIIFVLILQQCVFFLFFYLCLTSPFRIIKMLRYFFNGIFSDRKMNPVGTLRD